MTRAKLVSTSCFLIFIEVFFNPFGNIPPQNKDTEVTSVQKICLDILSVKGSECSRFGFGL